MRRFEARSNIDFYIFCQNLNYFNLKNPKNLNILTKLKQFLINLYNISSVFIHICSGMMPTYDNIGINKEKFGYLLENK